MNEIKKLNAYGLVEKKRLIKECLVDFFGEDFILENIKHRCSFVTFKNMPNQQIFCIDGKHMILFKEPYFSTSYKNNKFDATATFEYYEFYKENKNNEKDPSPFVTNINMITEQDEEMLKDVPMCIEDNSEGTIKYKVYQDNFYVFDTSINKECK